MLHEAMLYERRDDGTVECYLCAHHCTIRPGKLGVCGVRKNVDSALQSLVYGQVISQAVDPIEKKPLFHFLPGSASYSIATAGCNFRCKWCQNWEISQAPRLGNLVTTADIAPEEIVSAAERYGCASISYTYTEPTVFFEYAYDCARLAQKRGIANVFVTNGFMSPECLELLGHTNDGNPLLAAANVDLKAWSEDVYRRFIGGRLEPVLESLRIMKRYGIWVEVTTLLVPGINDDESQLRGIAEFIYEDLGPDTPWHVTRFFPHFRMRGVPLTPLKTVRLAREIGLETGLQYVYVGNLPDGDGESTFCPNCSTKLVERRGFRVLQSRLREGTCPECGTRIAGIWRR